MNHWFSRLFGKDTKLPVLLYHDFADPLPPDDGNNYAYITTPQRFEDNMTALLGAGYRSVSFAQLLGNKPLPRKPFIVTFDDGYDSNYTLIFPILKRLGVKASIFVVTDWMGKQMGDNLYFGGAAAREMQQSGLVEILSHSKRHVAAPSLPVAQFAQEVNTSLTELRFILEQNVLKVFAYPYGLYNDQTVQALAQDGMLAQNTGLGINWMSSLDLSSILRIGVPYGYTGADLIAQIESL